MGLREPALERLRHLIRQASQYLEAQARTHKGLDPDAAKILKQLDEARQKLENL